MFEYKISLYFPKSANNKGLEQVKKTALGIIELSAVYNKALNDCVWLLLLMTAQEFGGWNAVAPTRHLS